MRRGQASLRRVSGAVLAAGLLVLGASPAAAGPDAPRGPVAWWSFDAVEGRQVLDGASGTRDEVRGHFRIVTGAAGRALKLDGYTTRVVRAAGRAPRLSGEFTMEAWVALAAYPWNWCPVLSQESDGPAGYSFGIGPRGEFGIRVCIRGEWRACVSPAKLPLRRWAHIAATFREGSVLRVFLDGKEVAAEPVAGRVSYAGDADLLIGMNPDKRKPSHVVGPGVGTLAGWYSLDGILDEVKVFDRALGAGEVERDRASGLPAAPPDLPVPALPSAPPGPGRFGAYYTHLRYDKDWDALWPAGPAADVVVEFDGSPVRVVFWRGTRYSPAWVMENGQWMADQSVEVWDGTEGCYEHMQDPWCLHSQVRILDSGPARAVVHWRYAPVSSRGHFWRPDDRTGVGLWVDEYYTFYPDGVAVRKVVWPAASLGPDSPSELQETIPFVQPGQDVGDILEPEALTLLNLKGESRAYSWPGPWDDPDRGDGLLPEAPNIQVVRLKSRAKPFVIFEPGCRMHVYVGRVRKAVADFPAYTHWPVSLIPSDGRYAVAADRVASFSISFTDPPRHEGPDATTWASWLYGTLSGPAEGLVALAHSWVRPPALIVRRGDFSSEGYDISQRAYVLTCRTPGRPGSLECEIRASEDSPLANAALIVRGWGDHEARANLDAAAGGGARAVRVHRAAGLDGTDLVVWLETRSARPVRMVLEAR